MANTLLLLAIVAFGATVALAHGHKGGDHGKHGKHHGPPPPEVLRFKMLHFVHSTFCYGLALPNMSLPNAGLFGTFDPAVLNRTGLTFDPAVLNRTRLTFDPAVLNRTGLTFDPAMLNRTGLTFDPAVLNRTRLTVQPMTLRKPMVGAGKAFRLLVADASESDSSSSSSASVSSKSDSSKSDSKGHKFNTGHKFNETPKPNATVVAEEARLSRTVTKAAAAIVLSQAAGSNDAGCKALLKAEQEWIDYRKANNMSCKGNRKAHGPHGPQHGPGPHSRPMNGAEVYPYMNPYMMNTTNGAEVYPYMNPYMMNTINGAAMYPPPSMNTMKVPGSRAPMAPVNGAMNITRQTTTVVQNQRPMLFGKPAPKH